MSDEPDLMAELDVAEAIVMHGATVEIQWGWREKDGDVFVMHRLGEEAARALVAGQRRNIRSVTLVRRTVTYGPWEEAPGER